MIRTMREENAEHDYEYIAGGVVNVVSHPKPSRIAMRLGRYINQCLC